MFGWFSHEDEFIISVDGQMWDPEGGAEPLGWYTKIMAQPV